MLLILPIKLSPSVRCWFLCESPLVLIYWDGAIQVQAGVHWDLPNFCAWSAISFTHSMCHVVRLVFQRREWAEKRPIQCKPSLSSLSTILQKGTTFNQALLFSFMCVIVLQAFFLNSCSLLCSMMIFFIGFPQFFVLCNFYNIRIWL